MAHYDPSAADTLPPKTSWHPTDALRVLSRRRGIAILGFLFIVAAGVVHSLGTLPTGRVQATVHDDLREVDTVQSPLRSVMVVSAGGVLFGIVLAFLFEAFDSRIRTPEEIHRHLGVPFLGLVPTFADVDLHGQSPLLRPNAPPAFAEAIRAVRAALLFSRQGEGTRSVVITSTAADEGKTLVASSLAIALANVGKRTVVVDADMRRPRMHEALDAPQEPGLSNVLTGAMDLADVERPTLIPNLTVVPAGPEPVDASALLSSPRYGAAVAALTRRFDWIIIDAPPVGPVADAAILAQTASGVLFVVGAEMTPRPNARVAVGQLRGAQARFFGAILNRVNLSRHAYYYSPYYRKNYGKSHQRPTSGS